MLASGKKKAQVDRYGRAGSAAGWHFLTGEEASIKALTDAAGFHYVWDDKTQQFAHPSGIIVVTGGWPAGALFFRHRVHVAGRAVRADQSSAGRIGNAIDRLLLYCYHYDPATGSYGFVAMGAVAERRRADAASPWGVL